MLDTTHFKGKTVCVTGAGGSIGSVLCAQLIDHCEISTLKLVSISENALYNVNKALARGAEAMGVKLVQVLADAGDYSAMVATLEDCDIVIHAGAHKHVPLCEQNPLEAIRNNVGGTYQLARAADAAGVKQFLCVSSDKAVNPASIMGATKRVCELLLANWPVERKMKINVVRFGNVLDSAGSVFPLWREQVAKGGPVTITDPDCMRYFMSIPEAVELILTVLTFDSDNPCPHVFDMGEPKRMGDLLDAIIRRCAKPERIEIAKVGLRPGEKLVEELSFGGELIPTAHPKITYVCDAKALAAKDLLSLLSYTADRNARGALTKLWEIAK